MIMQITLENHQSTISMQGRSISNLRFSDGINRLAIGQKVN